MTDDTSKELATKAREERAEKEFNAMTPTQQELYRMLHSLISTVLYPSLPEEARAHYMYGFITGMLVAIRCAQQYPTITPEQFRDMIVSYTRGIGLKIPFANDETG